MIHTPFIPLLTMSHVIDAVQVPGTNLVEHVLALAPLDLQGLVAVEQLTRFPARHKETMSFCSPGPPLTLSGYSPYVLVPQLHGVRLGHFLL